MLALLLVLGACGSGDDASNESLDIGEWTAATTAAQRSSSDDRFLGRTGAGEPEADLSEPFGSLDFADVLAFLTAFGTGCP